MRCNRSNSNDRWTKLRPLRGGYPGMMVGDDDLRRVSHRIEAGRFVWYQTLMRALGGSP